MAISVHQIGFYFMNGIANEDKDGSKTTNLIQKIIQEAPNYQHDNTFVAFHYNDTAPTERMIIDTSLAVAGAVTTAFSLKKEIENEGTALTRLAGVAGISYLVGAVSDYNQMQKDKNKIAIALAKRVSDFLKENKSNIANLILHSQGADVGYRTLEILQNYKGRIRVITLGAMTTIPNSLCSQVINYKFTNDWVSTVLAFPFEISRKPIDEGDERTVIDLPKDGVGNHHDVHEYLVDSLVRNSLVNLLS